MDGGRNTCFCQFGLHGLPIIEKNGVLCKHTGPVSALNDTLDSHGVKHLVVAPTNFKTLLHFPFKAFHLGQHDRALDGVHPAANADTGVDVPLALTMNPDLPACLGNRVVASEDRTAVAVAAEGLAREEARAADVAQVAALAPLVFGAKALGSIFDHDQIVAVGDRVDLVHVGRLPVQADGHDGLGTGGDCRFDFGGVDVAGIRLDIHEDGFGTQQHDDFRGRDEGERRGDHLVTWLNAHGHKADQQGFGATGHGDAVLGAGVGL